MPDEKALVIASVEIKYLASQSQRTKRMAVNPHNLARVLDKDLGPIKTKSTAQYARRLIKRVNLPEPGGENQTKRSKTGEVRVAGLSNQRAKQCDSRLQ